MQSSIYYCLGNYNIWFVVHEIVWFELVNSQKERFEIAANLQNGYGDWWSGFSDVEYAIIGTGFQYNQAPSEIIIFNESVSLDVANSQ